MFHRGSRRTGESKGQGLVCINEDGDEEGWVLNEEVVQFIGSYPQADGIEVIHQVNGGEMKRGFFPTGFFTVSLH